ncbi:MAG: PAS domain-containing protein, partial [Alphaproteobacteria bacterium]|nr:PAS domain-containing protein [Alphaproteobacteria bacterium]
VLQETKERLEEAQRLGQMGSWTWEPEENVEWWSDEHYRIFGLEPGAVFLEGFGFLKYVHPDDRDRVEKIEREAVDNLTSFSTEYRVVWPDGTERTVVEQGEWIEDDTAGKPHWRGIVQDITERKRIEQELAQLNAELEERVEERTAELRAAQEELVKRERLATLGRLTATVSHELRNPLGAIRTSLYVVEKKTAQIDDRMAEAIGRINRSITRCDNIIDELLDFARVRDLQFQQLPVDECLIALLEEQPVPENISVCKNLDTGELRVSADPDRLRRAVINIYENACQAMKTNGTGADSSTASPSGHSLSISTRQSDSRIEIIVEDTGPGIAEESLDRIFEPLFSTKNFGAGLGLPIVRQIMEQHGGGVEAGNRKG